MVVRCTLFNIVLLILLVSPPAAGVAPDCDAVVAKSKNPLIQVDDLLSDWICRTTDRFSAERKQEMLNGAQDAIWPDMRERGCGHRNLEVPHVLKNPGCGRYVVDVGLGDDAAETVNAVNRGFVVFSFEMLPGNMEKIRTKLSRNPKLFSFVTLAKGEDGKWIVPEVEMPTSGTGHAFIFLAGLSDSEGTAMLPATGTSFVKNIHSGGGDTPVPVMPLARLVPPWAKVIEFLKLDTQGFELGILKGALPLVREHRFRYVLFEFSPWLMKRAKSGDPMELLQLLPQTGALCFDMMGTHNNLPRPSSPLSEYFSILDGGAHGSWKKVIPANDAYGPWDDIMCAWPEDLNGAAGAPADAGAFVSAPSAAEVVPALPAALPTWQAAPAAPAVSALPAWQAVPAAPAMPAASALPAWQAAPAAPAASALPAWQAAPAAPAASALPAWQAASALPAWQAAPAQSDVSPSSPKSFLESSTTAPAVLSILAVSTQQGGLQYLQNRQVPFLQLSLVAGIALLIVSYCQGARSVRPSAAASKPAQQNGYDPVRTVVGAAQEEH